MMPKQVGTDMRRIKVGSHLTTYMKINSEWIKGLNIMPKTVQILEENIAVHLHNIRLY